MKEVGDPLFFEEEPCLPHNVPTTPLALGPGSLTHIWIESVVQARAEEVVR